MAILEHGAIAIRLAAVSYTFLFRISTPELFHLPSALRLLLLILLLPLPLLLPWSLLRPSAHLRILTPCLRALLTYTTISTTYLEWPTSRINCLKLPAMNILPLFVVLLVVGWQI